MLCSMSCILHVNLYIDIETHYDDIECNTKYSKSNLVHTILRSGRMFDFLGNSVSYWARRFINMTMNAGIN
jgi:hypothetical protein